MSKQEKIWLLVGAVVVIAIAGFFIISSSNDRRGGSGSCNDNYSGACVPNVKNDIDCKSVGSGVTVVKKDVYHFDADNDGYGCESYDR